MNDIRETVHALTHLAAEKHHSGSKLVCFDAGYDLTADTCWCKKCCRSCSVMCVGSNARIERAEKGGEGKEEECRDDEEVRGEK